MPSKDQIQRGQKTGSKQPPAKSTRKNVEIHAQQPLHPASMIQQSRQASRSLTPAHVQHLQRTLGNLAVGSLLSTGEPRPQTETRLTSTPTHGAVEREAKHGMQTSQAAPEARSIQRRLIFAGKEVAKAEDLAGDLGPDYAGLEATIKKLIALTGPAVSLTQADLKEVHEYLTNQTVPDGRGAKIAVVNLVAQGAWGQAAQSGMKAKATLDLFNNPAMMAGVKQLGDFLEANPNVGQNMRAAGVGWELMSPNPYLTNFGGGAVIDERIHIQQWVLGKGEGFLRMALHEAGHATFQRLLITGEKFTKDANRGNEEPAAKALEEDGQKFYQAWLVLRKKPQHLMITDLPGDSPDAKGAGRAKYLAGKFTEFCAESFMHLALKKAELEDHIRQLPEDEPEVKAAWQSALAVLNKYESQILGRDQGNTGAKDTLNSRRRTGLFETAREALEKGLKGPQDAVVSIEKVRQELLDFKQSWEALTSAEREQYRGEALTILNQYIMKVQQQRPGQANLVSELGFTGL